MLFRKLKTQKQPNSTRIRFLLYECASKYAVHALSFLFHDYSLPPSSAQCDYDCRERSDYIDHSNSSQMAKRTGFLSLRVCCQCRHRACPHLFDILCNMQWLSKMRSAQVPNIVSNTFRRTKPCMSGRRHAQEHDCIACREH